MDASNEFTCNEKNALRKELIKRRAAIENRLERENAVVERLLSMTVSSCMIYVSIGSELCTHKAIETFLGSGVELYAPYTSGGEITPKKLVKLGEADARGNCPSDCYGGQAVSDIDVCVTPLLGFNSDGYRLGYGKGCYDKFFDRYKKTYRIGLAFDVQRVEFAPQPHDVPLDCCITESGVIYFNHARYLG